MSFFLTDPALWIKKSLERRTSTMANMSGKESWNQRQVFMKMTSNVRYENFVTKFKYGTSIMGGTLNEHRSTTSDKLNYSYDSNRNVPMPGITKVSVDFKGTKGGLRETKIDFVCWNLSQLSEMEMLYMSLGKTVVVEYGWSTTTEGISTSLDLLDENECALGQGPFQEAVLLQQERLDGCYDAVKGLVANFNWSVNSNGGFDCTTTLMSMAEVILSTDTKDPKGAGPCECENEDGGPCEDSDLQIFFKNYSDGEQGNGEFLKFPTGEGSKTNEKEAAGLTMRFDAEQTEEMKDNRKGFLSGDWFRGVMSNSIMTTMPYISWDAMEEAINILLLPEAKGSSTDDNKTTDHTKPLYSKFQNLVSRKTPCVGRVDSRNSLIKNHDLIASMDPFTCILPGQSAWEHPTYVAEGGGLEDVTNLGAYNKWKTFKCPSNLPDIKESQNKGFLSQILLNVYWLRKIERDVNTLEEFLNAVCDGVNNACGGVWTFSISTHPHNDQLLSVVDMDTTGKDSEEPLIIPCFGKNSIARSVTLNTEVSKELKAQIMYGSNRNAKNPDKKAQSSDEYDLFGGLKLKDLTPDMNNLNNDKPKICKDEDKPKTETEAEEEQLEAFSQAVGNLLDGVDSESINSALSALKALPDWPKSSTDWSPPILPITFGFSMDGHSGIQWGNVIRPNYIPTRYEGKVYFMVTKVKQDISHGSWETTVETILRVITKSGENWSSPDFIEEVNLQPEDVDAGNRVPLSDNSQKAIEGGDNT